MLGPDSEFVGSPYEDVGSSGLFPPHGPADCRLAVLANGEDSLAVRLEVLKAAQKSIRIQALVFKGDESGLRVAEILKQKKAAGLDVRIIVDAFSNPWLQTQWMYFDLKQHGIEVEGYEAMALQWLNEVPVPHLTPHFDPQQPDKRFHEKMWIVDGETAAAVAVTGGLNIGNEYFRANPADPDSTWRDQDVVVRGAIVHDLVTAFDRNFDYFVGVKKSRGIFNTNLYWDATRHVLDKTGKVPVKFTTNPDVVAHVAEIEARQPMLAYSGATCRFFQSRPRLKESYIQQAYVKLIERARSEVLIANAYFVPTATIKLALQDAAKRCVAVRLISNSPETNDLPEISLVGRGHYKDLLAVNETPEVAACQQRRQGTADLGVGRAVRHRGRAAAGHDALQVRGDRRPSQPGRLVQPRPAQRETEQRVGDGVRAARVVGSPARCFLQQRSQLQPRGDGGAGGGVRGARGRDRTLPQVDRSPVRTASVGRPHRIATRVNRWGLPGRWHARWPGAAIGLACHT